MDVEKVKKIGVIVPPERLEKLLSDPYILDSLKRIIPLATRAWSDPSTPRTRDEIRDSLQGFGLLM